MSEGTSQPYRCISANIEDDEGADVARLHVLVCCLYFAGRKVAKNCIVRVSQKADGLKWI
jgi:hypothetical protein